MGSSSGAGSFPGLSSGSGFLAEQASRSGATGGILEPEI
ncbi:hypothetical protein AOX55_00004963 (plasmid) [Sinorhizobium fredii CCBAU 25509]|nr:hypothetical protein AOX55_00004963 [Sinorhizobium fredii CCBAU 25509]